MLKWRKTKKIKIGSLYLGGNAPIVIQSMCNTDTRDVSATVAQIKQLQKVGCELVRLAVPDLVAAKAIAKIKKRVSVPLVADIHFSAELAMIAMQGGIDKLRLNPGNIGNEDKIKMVVLEAKKRKIPIRIGVNGGSLEKDILKKYKGKVTAQAMVESAMRHIKILEKYNFREIIISLKASDVARTVEAYRLLAAKVNYPLHIGVTEAGTIFRGTVVSSVGLGILLYGGIGDTLRVSLTADPVEEIRVAWEICKALGLRKRGITVTSCPTCGRTEIDLIDLAKKVESQLALIDKELHVAVMGCVVNGPGEAREADLAIVGGKGVGLIVKKGEVLRKVAEKDLLREFIKEVRKF